MNTSLYLVIVAYLNSFHQGLIYVTKLYRVLTTEQKEIPNSILFKTQFAIFVPGFYRLEHVKDVVKGNFDVFFIFFKEI